MACNYVYNVFGWLGDWSRWTSFIIHNYVIITLKTKTNEKKKIYCKIYLIFIEKFGKNILFNNIVLFHFFHDQSNKKL